MCRPVVFFVLLVGSRICAGQYDSVITGSDNYCGMKVSYNSSLIYPGISTGVELLIKTREVGIIKDKAQINRIVRNQLLTLNLNWYHHPGFHDNIYLTAEWVRRKVRHNGFCSEFSIGPGYSRTFLGGTTYRVSDEGTVSIKKLAGYSYVLATTGIGIGYDLHDRVRFPLSAYARMNLISMFPYNSTIYFRPVMELGVRFPVTHTPEIKPVTESYISGK